MALEIISIPIELENGERYDAGLEAQEVYLSRILDAEFVAVPIDTTLFSALVLPLSVGSPVSIRDEGELEAAEKLLTAVWSMPVVPVESSPLHGISLEDLAKRANSLGGLSIFLEGYAGTHHDLQLALVAPGLVLIAAWSTGMGENLRDRARRFKFTKTRGASSKKKK